MKKIFPLTLSVITICLLVNILRQRASQPVTDRNPISYISVNRTVIPEDPAHTDKVQHNADLVNDAIALIPQNANKAEQLLLQLERDPNTPMFSSTYFALAQCQEKLGKKQEALENYRKIVTKQHDHELMFMAAYALCALDNGQVEEAREVINKSIEISLENNTTGDVNHLPKRKLASNTSIDDIRAYAYLIQGSSLLLSRFAYLLDENASYFEHDLAVPQRYLEKSLKYSTDELPEAHLLLALCLSIKPSNPAEAQKHLAIASKYPEYMVYVKQVQKML
jgi:tetratricopeptide (TPR) repeat protein